MRSRRLRRRVASIVLVLLAAALAPCPCANDEDATPAGHCGAPGRGPVVDSGPCCCPAAPAVSETNAGPPAPLSLDGSSLASPSRSVFVVSASVLGRCPSDSPPLPLPSPVRRI